MDRAELETLYKKAKDDLASAQNAATKLKAELESTRESFGVERSTLENRIAQLRGDYEEMLEVFKTNSTLVMPKGYAGTILEADVQIAVSPEALDKQLLALSSDGLCHNVFEDMVGTNLKTFECLSVRGHGQMCRLSGPDRKQLGSVCPGCAQLSIATCGQCGDCRYCHTTTKHDHEWGQKETR